MIRAALKSLLGRKLRLLMSTFAIVLGVAFVSGTLIFTDTLDRSFTALFASTVGDVVVRPGEGNAQAITSSSLTIPAGVSRRARRRTRGGAGRRQRHGVRRLRRQHRGQGDRHVRPARPRCQLDHRARRARAGGAQHRRGHRAARPRRGGTGRPHRREGGLRRGRPDPHPDRRQHRAARADTGRHRRLPEGRVAQRRDARDLRHPRRPRSCSSTATTRSPTSG